MVKNPPACAGDVGLIPRLGRSPGEGNGNPLQYSFFFFSTPIFLSGKPHGQRSLVGYSLWDGRVGSDLATKQHILGA